MPLLEYLCNTEVNVIAHVAKYVRRAVVLGVLHHCDGERKWLIWPDVVMCRFPMLVLVG